MDRNAARADSCSNCIYGFAGNQHASGMGRDPDGVVCVRFPLAVQKSNNEWCGEYVRHETKEQTDDR